jgi:hypothetical protein
MERYLEAKKLGRNWGAGSFVLANWGCLSGSASSVAPKGSRETLSMERTDMMQQDNATVTTEAAKKGKSPKSTASTPIRIKIQSKGKLDALLARVNRDRIGRWS